jgi:hypothetical protein
VSVKMTAEQRDYSALLEKVDGRYHDPLQRYLELASANEMWLQNFPQEQEWILGFSNSQAWQALAKERGIKYVPQRNEEDPTWGQALLELAQRRHTAADAIESKTLKWGTGWARVKEVNRTSAQEILTALQQATDRLAELLLTNSPDTPITQVNFQGQSVRTLSALDALTELTDHEKRHAGDWRILYDAAQAIFPSTYKFAAPQTPVSAGDE